ncbi:MAG: DNA polymerase III subunit beta [Clostridia bacterium]|nr:DNA polymerase III subunit beta [Clostridia bacterium]
MKVTFSKDALLLAITRSLGCVSSDKTMGSIEGIYLGTTSQSECMICAYDYEKGLKTYISAEVEQSGTMVINGTKLASIVKFMPGSITIETSENGTATISSGKSKFQLYYISGENFPPIPELSPDRFFTLPQNVLRRLINQTSFAISHDESRPVLTGLYFEVTAKKVRVVSCDSFRLAIRDVNIDTKLTSNTGEEEFRFILPGKTVNEIVRLIDDKDEDIKFSLTRKRVIISMKMRYGDEERETTMFSRLIDQMYLEYERFIPKESKTFVTIDKRELSDALERAALVTEDRIQGQAKSIVKLSFEGQMLNVFAESINGKVYNEIQVEKEGPDLLIGFDCKKLLDIMTGCDDETIKLSLTSALMSMVVEGADTEEKNTKFLYLAIPMKMRDN